MIKRLKELLFQNRSTKQTVAKNIFWLSFSEVASRFIRGIIVVYAARILGASEFGIFSYALGLAALFTIFSDIGIIQVLTRELVQRPNDRDKYFATAFIIKFALLIFTALAIALLAPLFSLKTAVKLIPFMAILVFFDGLREFSLSFFRAIERMEITGLVTLITNLTIVISSIIALLYYKTSTSLAITYLIGSGVGALVAITLLRNEYRKIWKHFDKTLVRKILSYSWPLLFTGMFGSFMLNTDNVLIGYFKGESAVGLYSAAQKIIQILYVLPALVATAIFPTISRYVTQNESNKIKNMIEKGMILVFMIAIPIAIGGMLAAKQIILFLYNEEYINSILSFRILLLSVFLVFPGAILGNLALAYNKQKNIAKYIGIAALANAIGDIILIPIYGIAGSAAVTLIAQLITNGFQWRLLKKINNFYTLRYLKKIAISSILMGALDIILIYLTVPIVFIIIISAPFYFMMLYLLKEPALQELIGMIGKI